MFRFYVDSMKESKKDILTKDGFKIIKVQNSQNTFYYAFHDEESFSGEGSFGKVYKAHLINEKTFELDLTQSIAVKVVPLDKFRKSELETLQHFQGSSYYRANQFHGVDWFFSKRNVYILTPFYEDLPLPEYPEDKSNIEGLNFIERIRLITQILLQFNHLHYEKIYKAPGGGVFVRPAMVHGDVKNKHLIVSVRQTKDEKELQTDVRLIDFGFAVTLPCQNHFQNGTIDYLPPEILADGRFRDTAMDIYALTPIIAQILGVNNPFSYKMEFEKYECWNIARAPYSFVGLMESPLCRGPRPILKKCILMLLKRMQDKNPASRPDINELLHFFTALNKHCIYFSKYQEKNEEETLNDSQIELCKLILIATGCWYTPLSDKFISPAVTFEQYDFVDKIPFVHAFLLASEVFLLNQSMVKAIFLSLPNAEQIIALHKSGELTHQSLSKVLWKNEPVATIPAAHFKEKNVYAIPLLEEKAELSFAHR